MRRIAVLTVMALLLARAPGAWTMDMEPKRDNPERAHMEQAEREMREHREGKIRHAEEMHEKAKRLLREAAEIQAHAGAEREADELREKAKRLMAEAEALRRDLKDRPDPAHKLLALRALSTTETPRVLVLPLDALAPEEMAQIVEDLTVMGRVLEKVIAREFGEELPVMGPGMPGGPFSALLGQQNLPSMYLEGYGAVFFLRVGFPLSGAAPSPEREREEGEDGLWEQTRRELHGPPAAAWSGGTPRPERGGGFDPDWLRSRRRFDPERVERLKDAVLDALRHAARIRTLGRDESVAVVVMGAEGGMPTIWRPRAEGYAGPPEFSVEPGMGLPVGGPVLPKYREGRSGSILVIRAEQEDIEALAEARMEIDEFAEEATILMQ